MARQRAKVISDTLTHVRAEPVYVAYSVVTTIGIFHTFVGSVALVVSKPVL